MTSFWPPIRTSSEKGYVTVPDDLLQNTDALKPYLELSYNYVLSLKPKSSKKK